MNINKNLHSKTSLTEFSRDFEDESKETVLTKLVNKIYVACNNANTDSQVVEHRNDEVQTSSTSESSSSISIPSDNADPREELKIASYQVDTSLGRTPSNVIKRISNLLAMKDKDLNDYKNTELKKLWMPDNKSRECYDCSAKFNTFRRKHHCRLCGQIFCKNCCSQIVSGKIINVNGDLRVCNYCSKVVLSYLKSADISAALKTDLQALEDDLSNKFVGASTSSSVNNTPSDRSPHRKVSVGYQEERLVSHYPQLSIEARKSILQQSNSLKALYDEMIKFFHDQIKGFELVHFLITNQKCTNKQQAEAVLIAMIEANFIVPVLSYENVEGAEDTFQIEFNSNLYYKLSKTEEILSQLEKLSDPSEDSEVEDIIPPSMNSESLLSSTNEQELQSSILTTAGSKPILEAYCEHEELFLHQLLRNENLEASWSRTLINLCARIAHTIHPEFGQFFDSMDVRTFVNIKKISGGRRTECTIVGGVVFSKNVAHRDMKTKIDDPKVLLLQCPIAYQRVEGKFVTIESLILQEKEYLSNVCSRILSFRPDVVLAHKNVAGIAQDMLRDNGITLVLDVKLSVFERLSQCLECDIVTSIDSNIGRPKLGQCKKFYTKGFIDANGFTKTLMFFDIPFSQRGCSLLLRGGSESELTKVKKVASFLLFARYNFRLELSYLLDVFAQPPPPKQSIFDSIDQNASETTIKSEVGRGNLELQKSDSYKKEKSVNIENVSDFSDPLRAENLSSINYGGDNIELEVQHPFDNKFRTSLNSMILSISPFITFSLPYFETEAGRKCNMRKFFPTELFYSKQWFNIMEKVEKLEESVILPSEHLTNSNEIHKFLTINVKNPADHKEVQTGIADYRRCGGQFKKVILMKKIERKAEAVRQKSSRETLKDALDIYNHQRLPVLFCSYYYNIKDLPTSFCAQPLLLNMHFYGQDDIMLGLFLERYCFRSSYICRSCKLPMMNHVRKYAHSMGVITVRLAEDPIKNESSSIVMTSRCTLCNTMTPRKTISSDVWCFSLAKFLELKFHGHSYTRRHIDDDATPFCQHSIHRDFIQYFSSNGIIVSFSYSPVEIWDIQLPYSALQLKSSEIIDKKIFGEKIKTISVKGYEVYAKIHEKLANLSSDVELPMLASLKKVLHRDQLIFKHRVEVVYTLLSSNEVYATEINDAMFMMHKELADSIELWGPRLSEAAIQIKHSQKNESLHQVVEEMDDELNEVDLEFDSNIMAKSSEEFQTDKREKIDKKTIKRLLSTLLPSSSDQNTLPTPFSPNEHFLPTGQFPILVLDFDLSSIIAYSLMTYDHKKSLENLVYQPSEPVNSNNSPSFKRKNQNEGSNEGEEKDASNSRDTSEKKKQTSNHHVDIQFHDSTTHFTCKILFAKEFDDLRLNCLVTSNSCKQIPSAPDESFQADVKAANDDIRKSFARSLSQSQKWEARGGKSGSKFSKTNDDCFILKEMSKNDVVEFENFAAHYFEYVNQCVKEKLPSLLAKIFGVYKVGIKKKDSQIERSVLVIENLFRDRKINDKYDLKGSERNRLVDTTGHTPGETVLLDENLVKASWTKPLYILTHSQTVLRDAICRDASFLERNHVMDYSMLVGLDEKFLVIGIIDYIRKFTIDKRLESYFKQVVDQTKLPTIVSPNVYKTRFIEAMDRYFLNVPDRWDSFMLN